MGNKLPVPPELLSLIEKREGEDRRQSDRRKATKNAVTPGPAEERRKTPDRRKKSRRK